MMHFNHSSSAGLRFSILLLAGIVCYTVGVMGQERKQEPPIVDPSTKEKVDARAMVEALANHNPPPKLIGPHHNPIFDPKFDWPEDGRVWDASELLIRHAEDAWPELVSHLDDERYCMTLKWWSGFTYTWTVGDMCREIISRNLSAAYYQNLKRPGSKSVYARMSRPEVARDKKKLKSWCEERSKKKLYELQIEMCEWAMQELAKPDDHPLASPLRLRAWIAAIEADIESLRESETAVRYHGFGGEEVTRYSSKKAEELRERSRNEDER